MGGGVDRSCEVITNVVITILGELFLFSNPGVVIGVVVIVVGVDFKCSSGYDLREVFERMWC